MIKFIKNNKKLSLSLVLILLVYSISFLYQYNTIKSLESQVFSAKQEILEKSKLSYEEKQKKLIEGLYNERQGYINNISDYKNLVLLSEKDKNITEHIIRCEKKNMFRKIKDNCNESWKNYPKK